MATISDISKATGLARTTVAEVLRGKEGYRESTRRHVLTVADELGYQPNYLSKALAGGPSMTIGIIVPTISRPLTTQRLWEIETRAREHGYLTYVAGWGDDPFQQMARYLKDFLRRRVDGLIIHSDGRLPLGVEELLQNGGVPYVFFEGSPPGAQACVKVDRTQAMSELAAYLKSLGHRRAAFMSHAYHLNHPWVWADMARSALDHVGIAVEPIEPWTIGEDNNIHDFLIRQMIGRDRLPTVFLGFGDEKAHAVIAALQRAGLRVPDDVSVVGSDDMPIAAVNIPRLTTIHQPRQEVGAAAFELLMKLMSGCKDEVPPRVFNAQLIKRESVGPVSNATDSQGYLPLKFSRQERDRLHQAMVHPNAPASDGSASITSHQKAIPAKGQDPD